MCHCSDLHPKWLSCLEARAERWGTEFQADPREDELEARNAELSRVEFRSPLKDARG